MGAVREEREKERGRETKEGGKGKGRLRKNRKNGSGLSRIDLKRGLIEQMEGINKNSINEVKRKD